MGGGITILLIIIIGGGYFLYRKSHSGNRGGNMTEARARAVTVLSRILEGQDHDIK